jgi:hypothetical protein
MHEPEGVLERDLRKVASDSLGDPQAAAIERTLELGVGMAARGHERMFSYLRVSPARPDQPPIRP